MELGLDRSTRTWVVFMHSAHTNASESSLHLPSTVLGTYLKAPRLEHRDVDVTDTVREVLADIAVGGVAAVRQYSQRFDGWNPASFRVQAADIQTARSRTDDDLVAQIDGALENIRAFAGAQRDCIRPLDCEIRPGVRLGHR
ncbi:MAG: hypothetical protein F4X30_05615, partial [Acidimicrobiaceae bacterium]|nr:hypothetical protein [Acidimicrobiaceae bacterium]